MRFMEVGFVVKVVDAQVGNVGNKLTERQINYFSGMKHKIVR